MLLVALNTSWRGGDVEAVAFYTDTEQSIEPVTEGVQMILQYDVEVTEYQEEDGDDEWAYGGKPWLSRIHVDYSCRSEAKNIGESPADKAASEEVITVIAGLHQSDVQEGGFRLQIST